MEFICGKNQLLESLLVTQKAVSSKVVIPAMSGILFEVGKNLSLVATDLELSIKTSLEANIKQQGSAILPARYLTDIIRNMNSENIHITVTDQLANIKGGKANFNINTLHVEEFPEAIPSDLESVGYMQSASLKRGVSYVIKASAKDESRPVLSGVLLKLEDKNLEFATTDSYRLAVYKETMESGQEKNLQLIIPSKTMDEVVKIIGNNELKIEIEASESHIKFNVGNVQVVSRLIDGQYPAYGQLIPSEFIHSIKINVNELMASVRRISSIAGQNPIKFNFEDNNLLLTASNQGIGEAEDTLEIQYKGEAQTIAFNPNYLLDGLSVIEQGEALINLNEPNKPVLLKTESENFDYIIMPVRVS